MSSLSIDGFDVSCCLEGLFYDEPNRFSILSPKDFESIQTLVNDKIQPRIQPQSTDSSSSPFNFTKEKEILQRLIDSHFLSPLVRETCNQWLYNLENQIRLFDLFHLEDKKRVFFQTIQIQIGKLLFLGERYPQEIETLLLSTKSAFTAIEKRFAQEIETLTHELENESDDGKWLTTETARLLLNQQGQIHFPLVPTLSQILSQVLSSLNRPLSPYERILPEVLQKIDLSWQPILDSFQELPVKQAILAAFLTYLVSQNDNKILPH